MSLQQESPASVTAEQFAEHPLFSDLPAEYRVALVAATTPVTFDAAQVIFREGEPADRFFLIVDGQVTLESFSLQYGSTPVQTLESGEVFGWSVLVPPYRWRLDARATRQSKILVVDGAALRERCEKDPSLGYALLQRFAMLLDQRLHALRNQLIERYTRSW